MTQRAEKVLWPIGWGLFGTYIPSGLSLEMAGMDYSAVTGNADRGAGRGLGNAQDTVATTCGLVAGCVIEVVCYRYRRIVLRVYMSRIIILRSAA